MNDWETVSARRQREGQYDSFFHFMTSVSFISSFITLRIDFDLSVTQALTYFFCAFLLYSLLLMIILQQSGIQVRLVLLLSLLLSLFSVWLLLLWSGCLLCCHTAVGAMHVHKYLFLKTHYCRGKALLPGSKGYSRSNENRLGKWSVCAHGVPCASCSLSYPLCVYCCHHLFTVQSAFSLLCSLLFPYFYSDTLEELKKNGEAVVTEEQALQLAKQINAHKYMRCSARTMKGLT